HKRDRDSLHLQAEINQRMDAKEKSNARRHARHHLILLPRNRPFDAAQGEQNDACHQHRSKEKAQSLEYLQVGIMGHLPHARRTDGLVSEHWENVSESPISVPQHGSAKNGPHRNRVYRNATLIAEALLRDLPDSDIAEIDKGGRHQE